MELNEIQASLDNLKKEVGSTIDASIAKQMESQKADLEKMIEGHAKAEVVEAMKKEIESSLKAISEQIKDGKTNKNVDPIAKLTDELFADKSKLTALTDEKRTLSFNIEAAAGNITTSNLTSTATPYDGRSFEIDMNPSALARKAPLYKQLFSLRGTSSAIVHYMDEVLGEGDGSFVGEGVSGSKRDYDLAVASSIAKKAIALTPFSEEVITDASEFYNFVRNLVTVDLDLVIDDAIFFDTLSATKLKGLTTYTGIAFPAAAGFENSVEGASLINAVLAAIGAIANRGEGNKFMADKVALNVVDWFNLWNVAAQANYTNNPLISIQGSRVFIAGVEVTPSNRIPSGKIFACDSSVVNIRPLNGTRIELGYESGNWEKGITTMKAEQRLHSYVKVNEVGGILYDDITTIKDLINIVGA